jgi:hypothetical protein
MSVAGRMYDEVTMTASNKVGGTLLCCTSTSTVILTAICSSLYPSCCSTAFASRGVTGLRAMAAMRTPSNTIHSCSAAAAFSTSVPCVGNGLQQTMQYNLADCNGREHSTCLTVAVWTHDALYVALAACLLESSPWLCLLQQQVASGADCHDCLQCLMEGEAAVCICCVSNALPACKHLP